MWDTLKCSDKKWVKKYVKKAEFYYKYKFNPAVRKAIGEAGSTCYDDRKHVPCYDYDDMLLNSDRAKIYYLRGKESYLKYAQNVMNPIFNENVVYGYDEMTRGYFCIIKAEWSKKLERGEGVLRLTSSGWLPDLIGNPYYDYTRHNDVFDDTLHPADRNKVEKFIKEKVKEGWFYDFVEIEKL